MKKLPSRRKVKESKPSVVSQPNPMSSGPGRIERIAVAAYYRAQARGFVPGHEMDDWLEAKAEIDEMEKA